jgi:hypothetical protein
MCFMLLVNEAAADIYYRDRRRQDRTCYGPRLRTKIITVAVYSNLIGIHYAKNLDDYRLVFNQVDPMGISFDDNSNEYDPEINELLQLAPDFNETETLKLVLSNIFSRYFKGVMVPQDRISLLAERLSQVFGESEDSD